MGAPEGRGWAWYRCLGATKSRPPVPILSRSCGRGRSYAGRGADAKDLGPDFDTGITVSNGGLNAPLGDMAKYLAFLLGAVAKDGDAAAVLAQASVAAMWEPVLPTRADGSEHIGLCFFVQEHGGTRFATHTGGQREFVTFFYVHPASGTAALGAWNSSAAGPVMADLRRQCMTGLSLPLHQRGS